MRTGAVVAADRTGGKVDRGGGGGGRERAVAPETGFAAGAAGLPSGGTTAGGTIAGGIGGATGGGAKEPFKRIGTSSESLEFGGGTDVDKGLPTQKVRIDTGAVLPSVPRTPWRS